MIVIEPSNNIWSSFVYRLLAHEPFNTNQVSWKFPFRDPLFDSNQALSWIVFQRDIKDFRKLFPQYTFIKYESLMPLSYILTGGHTFDNDINIKLIKYIRKIVRLFLDRQFGLFDCICIEKDSYQ